MFPLLAAILPALIGAGGSIAGGLIGNKKTSKVPYEQEMKQLLAKQMTQMTQADPLRQAMLAWAQGLTPTYARPPATTTGARVATPRERQATKYDVP